MLSLIHSEHDRCLLDQPQTFYGTTVPLCGESGLSQFRGENIFHRYIVVTLAHAVLKLSCKDLVSWT